MTIFCCPPHLNQAEDVSLAPPSLKPVMISSQPATSPFTKLQTSWLDQESDSPSWKNDKPGLILPYESRNRGLLVPPSPHQPHAVDAPDAVENEAHKLLKPDDLPDQAHPLRPRPSRESARPSISTTHSKYERPSSATRPKPAVRLPCLEQAAAPQDLTRLNASQVLCNLIVTYHGDLVARIEDAIVEYERDTAFQELGAIAIKELLQKCAGRPPEAFYLKVGRFRLIRHDTNKVFSRCILESQREWDEYLPSKIPKFRGDHPGKPFHIEVEWDYSSLHIEQVPGQSYAETIGSAIELKIRKNWEGKKYVPEKDLEKILTEDTISKLIREDGTLYGAKFLTLNGGKKLDVDGFIKEIWLWGGRLLALCVYTDLPLICLYHMWLEGIRDKNLPLTENHCPDPLYRRRFDMAVSISGGFAAHKFAKNETDKLEHLQLDPGVVVPILFDKTDPTHMLGKGSFGKVFRVHIDRDHHSFSEFEEEPFAFKIFYDLSAHTQRNVENESGTLARLAEAPHPNVTTHLASWNQNGICYMLFRCADCNLRTYMKQKSPTLTKSNLLALLSQMTALADGLRHIHNLGPGLEPERVDEKARLGKKSRSQTCFHHDLKPGNILVTTNRDTGDLLFSISDFGSAKIGQILSGTMQPSPFTQNQSPGDAVYSAPDAILEGKTSRPYDLWSMGCIFLELLTWILGPEDDIVAGFAGKRMEEVSNAHGNQDEAFWYRNTAGKIMLKPAVVHQLKVLKERCAGRGVFPALVRIVGKLLNILPSDRPEASKLYSDLDAIMLQVKRDLKNENFYIDKLSTEVRIAAPPSSNGDSDYIERRPSIDERAIPARFGETLHPDPRANRRSTVGSIHHTVGPRRPSAHGRHQSTPEADVQLSSRPLLDIDTRVESSSPTNGDEMPNTPRISLSDFDNDPAREEALLHMGGEGESKPLIGSHNSSFLPGLQKLTSSDSRVFE